MKIRQGFVSNSSSSSFVLAMHKDCTREYLKSIILEDKEALKLSLEAIENYHYYGEVKESFSEMTTGEKIEAMAEEIAKDLYESLKYSTIKLGDWMVCSDKYGNDEDYIQEYIYNNGSFDEDLFKMKCTD